MHFTDEEIAEALANGEEVIPLNMEPTLVELLDIGVQRLKERPTWKVRSVSDCCCERSTPHSAFAACLSGAGCTVRCQSLQAGRALAAPLAGSHV